MKWCWAAGTNLPWALQAHNFPTVLVDMNLLPKVLALAHARGRPLLPSLHPEQQQRARA
jgi:hypothetical protein